MRVKSCSLINELFHKGRPFPFWSRIRRLPKIAGAGQSHRWQSARPSIDKLAREVIGGLRLRLLGVRFVETCRELLRGRFPREYRSDGFPLSAPHLVGDSFADDVAVQTIHQALADLRLEFLDLCLLLHRAAHVPGPLRQGDALPLLPRKFYGRSGRPCSLALRHAVTPQRGQRRPLLWRVA